MEKAFPYATRLLVVGKRDAGSDAPAKVQSSREQVQTCSLLLCAEKIWKTLLTFWVPIIIISLWNSKSEVIRCLHEPEGRKRTIPKGMMWKFDWTMKQQNALMNIAPSMVLHGQKLFGKGLIYFWHKKSETAAPPWTSKRLFLKPEVSQLDKSILSQLGTSIKWKLMEV